MQIRPFQIDVSQTEIDDLRRRIAQTRWPDQFEDAGWELGVEQRYLRGLMEYWADVFDSKVCLGELNWLPQFKASIDSYEVHFVHARSEQPDALPLIITHGW